MKFSYFSFIFFLGLISCGVTETTEDRDQIVSVSKDTIEPTEVSAEVVQTTWTRANFEQFWKTFSSQTGDKNYLIARIDFPYGNGFETISKSAYEKEGSSYSIHFQDQSKVTFSMLEPETYLNGNLSELFKEKYTNLEDIYVVRNEDDPTGYYAYFKYFDNTFKLIGFEETMDASN